MRKVDFLGIGAHGAGTTWIWRWLSRHPKIGFLKSDSGQGIIGKECHYWDRNSSKSVQWYYSQFDWSRPIVGEITPAYARLPTEVINDVAKTCPHAKVFFVIRDPLDRTWSDIRKRRRKLLRSNDNPTCGWYINQASRQKVWIRNDYLRTVKNWHRDFGADRLRVYKFEDFVKSPRPHFSDLLSFLGANKEEIKSWSDAEINTPVNCGVAEPIPEEFSGWFSGHFHHRYPNQIGSIRALGCLAELETR